MRVLPGFGDRRDCAGHRGVTAGAEAGSGRDVTSSFRDVPPLRSVRATSEFLADHLELAVPLGAAPPNQRRAILYCAAATFASKARPTSGGRTPAARRHGGPGGRRPRPGARPQRGLVGWRRAVRRRAAASGRAARCPRRRPAHGGDLAGRPGRRRGAGSERPARPVAGVGSGRVRLPAGSLAHDWRDRPCIHRGRHCPQPPMSVRPRPSDCATLPE
jgi:hypothetical protein